MNADNPRSTIGLKKSTKARLDRSRAPGQCYDGFLCQLVNMWEEAHRSDELNHSRPLENYGYQSIR
ncbi:MAG: hypothetical protein JW954_02430 [Dehalococcoidaceae bacterium]|nr:hypothetical protein [Dehalococcoidaceae bacterium]